MSYSKTDYWLISGLLLYLLKHDVRFDSEAKLIWEIKDEDSRPVGKAIVQVVNSIDQHKLSDELIIEFVASTGGNG
jgi:hypothetical protein